MKNRSAAIFAVVLLMIGFLGITTGCNEKLALSNGITLVNQAAFGIGWALGSINAPTTTERLCYQNGVQIDCADLPEEFGQ